MVADPRVLIPNFIKQNNEFLHLTRNQFSSNISLCLPILFGSHYVAPCLILTSNNKFRVRDWEGLRKALHLALGVFYRFYSNFISVLFRMPLKMSTLMHYEFSFKSPNRLVLRLVLCLFSVSFSDSGEIGFRSMCSFVAFAYRPMLLRIGDLDPHIPITFIYGSRSWIDMSSGIKTRAARPESYVDIKVWTPLFDFLVFLLTFFLAFTNMWLVLHPKGPS